MKIQAINNISFRSNSRAHLAKNAAQKAIDEGYAQELIYTMNDMYIKQDIDTKNYLRTIILSQLPTVFNFDILAEINNAASIPNGKKTRNIVKDNLEALIQVTDEGPKILGKMKYNDDTTLHYLVKYHPNGFDVKSAGAVISHKGEQYSARIAIDDNDIPKIYITKEE